MTGNPLKVLEAYTRDVGRGVCRIDYESMDSLKARKIDKIGYGPNPDKNTRFRILEVHTKGKPIGRDIDLMKIAEMTNGFSGAEVSAVVNTAISLDDTSIFKNTLHLKKAAKHTSDAVVSSQYFEEAVRKIKKQRDTRPGEPIASTAHL